MAASCFARSSRSSYVRAAVRARYPIRFGTGFLQVPGRDESWGNGVGGDQLVRAHLYVVNGLSCPSENELYVADNANWQVQKSILHPVT
jgi:hypothetical protein